jgi:hypothetical protein
MTPHRDHTRSAQPAGALTRAWTSLTVALAARMAYLRAHPDDGAETAEIVIGIALAAGAAITIWHFLGPALVDIARNALGSV